MGKLLRGCVVSALLLAAGTARAECSVSSDPGAVAHPLKASVQADVELILVMGALPKLMHVDYDGAAKKTGCELGPLAPGDAAYTLWGDDAHGRQRKAIPAKKGAPVALILPVVNVMKALMAAQQQPGAKPPVAPTEGYLLATVARDEVTGWIYYTGMPDADTLKHDMAEMLAGHGHPIFRSHANGKTDIFVPAS